MFADPITLAYDSVSTTLPRIYEEKNGTKYSTADDALSIEIAHTLTRSRKRSVMKLIASKTSPDPFVAGATRPVGATSYIVLDRPLAGFSHEELVTLIQGLCDYLVADTNAAAKKFAGGEA